MKKITREAVLAFLNNYEYRNSNTEVTIGMDRELKLFGNTIARYNRGDIELTDAGWQSNTTKERLNGLLELLNLSECKVYQKNYTWYFDKNGERMLWDVAKQYNGFVSLDYMRGA